MNKKPRLDKRAFEAFGAIFFGVFLNVVITVTLIANQHVTFTAISIGLFRSLAIYILLGFVIFFVLLADKRRWLKSMFIIVIGFMTWHLLFNLFFLVVDPKIQDNGVAILVDAFLIWVQNVIVFALWYWFWDRGGPLKREMDDDAKADFSFPQQQATYPGWEKWKPRFMDYIYLSYTNSISFAPADTVPLSRKVKYFMMSQAGISLIIIGMVASRAMNLIK